jgi:hypothetical protein
VAYYAGPLAAHSGATVRDFHPLPFSLANLSEHLEHGQSNTAENLKYQSKPGLSCGMSSFLQCSVSGRTRSGEGVDDHINELETVIYG